MSRFTHLHTHSHYSLLDGLTKIGELLDRCQELGMDSIALTDHGVMYGLVEFYQEALKREIKPILGSEVYIAPNGLLDKRPHIDDKPDHLVLLVKDEEGYRNLIKMTTIAHLQGFYYKPRVDKELLKNHAKGLIALSSCLKGEVPQAVIKGDPRKAEKLALEYQKIFGPGNFYLEIQHHPGLANQEKANKEMREISRRVGIPLVATNDVHYLKPEDAEAQDILLCIQTNHTIQDKDRLSMLGEDLSMRSPKEMTETFKDVPEAISNTQEIVKKCNFELELGKTQFPHFEIPNNSTPDQCLKKLCYQGLANRYQFGSDTKLKKEVLERLEYELGVIEKTGFASYFLIVQDLMNWAKNQGIVTGPGRGSTAGSLVAYLLNITNVDPIKYDLVFERFLNPERISMPDADLDFADTRRDEVIEYVAQKYGRDNVAQIITFGTMAARAAIRDTGRALGLAYTFCDQIAKMIPMSMTLGETLAKVKELKDIYERDGEARRLIDTARKLEGVARHSSVHACGVVITKDSLDNHTPRQFASRGDQVITTQYEMHAIEALGLLKMDFLGLKNLTTIEDTLNLIEKTQDKKINIDEIPLDDPETFKLFQEGRTNGIFQYECLTDETYVSNTTIGLLYKKRGRTSLRSIYLDEGQIHNNKILNVIKSGKKKVYILITEDNRYIRTTKNHRFLTDESWKKLADLKPGNKILIKKRAKYLVYNSCKICGKQISGQENGKSNFCYKCSAKFYSNPSKPYSKKQMSIAKRRYFAAGNTTWNSGLTKKDNKILRKTAKKVSEALTGRTFEEFYGPEKAKRMKKQMSIRNSGENNPMFGKKSPHRKGGFRKDLGHYVRSTWEADFARILISHNIRYEYEPETFRLKRPDNKHLSYTPDFYVKSTNSFYEIKGWFHELDKEKIELFEKQYPEYNLILIDRTKFAELALKYKNLIKWECPKMPFEKGFEFIRVKKIKYSGIEMTYDILMQSPGNNFIANGFVVHNSGGMKRYLKQLKPTVFEDLISMVALYRPGPMEYIPEFIAGHHGKIKPTYVHPKLEPILSKTYGIVVFQEQVLQIARDLAGFTMGEADILRKAVGKKIKKLLLEQKEKFFQGCEAGNISKEIAEKVFAFIEPHAGYSFNRAHSTCYAIIGYETAYLKTHYPAEFMAALLSSEEGNIERTAFLVEECRQMNIQVLPPDINESYENFTVIDKNTIRFGLGAIKNVGLNVIDVITEERKTQEKFQSIGDLIERVNSPDLNKKSLESLIKCGALDQLEERGKLLTNLELILKYTKNIHRTKSNGQVSLFANQPDFISSSFKLIDSSPAKKQEKLSWEKELLGLYVSEHPLKEYAAVLSRHAMAIKKLGDCHPGEEVRIGGIISNIQKIITRKGQPMLFVKLEDLNSSTEVLVFPNTLSRNPIIWQEDKIVFIQGRVNTRDGDVKVICSNAQELQKMGSYSPFGGERRYY